MSKTKKIQIKAEYLSSQNERIKKRKVKPKVNRFITPNKVKRALIGRIKEYQKKQEEKKNTPKPVFATDFKKTLHYLDSVVGKKKTIKQERKKRRRQRGGVKANQIAKEQSIYTKITTKDDPPYGILKGGKKPLYSQYKKTLRNKKSTSIVLPPESTPSIAINLPRQEKLAKLRRKIKAPTRKIRKRRYTLGKRKRKVGILIKSRETRRKIKKEHSLLKKKNLYDIRLYLKKHGLIKVGSAAPENVLREIYETAVLSGDVYNKNNEVLVHNFINDKKKDHL